MARQFGHTWWGRAWVHALENRALLDPNRLPRGRTYARHDRVSTLHLAPGEITAFVRGNRPGRYRVLVRVRTYDDGEWERVITAIAGRAGHAAALLEGELDPGVVSDAEDVGVELLPGPGDLQPRCSCPDWADPCKHAAAVCYLVADVLDEDPFALFTVRGRRREELLSELRTRRRVDARPAAEVDEHEDDPFVVPVDEGQVAREVWRSAGSMAPVGGAAPALDTARGGLDAERHGSAAGAGSDAKEHAAATTDVAVARHQVRRAVPIRPGAPAPWPTDPPEQAPFTAEGLHGLATDAAARAWAQLRGEGRAGLDLDAEADLARRAAAVLGQTPPFTALARASATPPVDLARSAIAWQHGGRPALRILSADPWRPPVTTMAAARSAVVDSLPSSTRVHVSSNRITAGPLQLRLDPAGRWWRFEKRRGRWEITAPAADHPDDLLSLDT